MPGEPGPVRPRGLRERIHAIDDDLQIACARDQLTSGGLPEHGARILPRPVAEHLDTGGQVPLVPDDRRPSGDTRVHVRRQRTVQRAEHGEHLVEPGHLDRTPHLGRRDHPQHTR